jgi:hypothetical protein
MHHTTKLLEDARAKVNFPLKEMTKVVYGNDEIYNYSVANEKVFDSYPAMKNDADYWNLSRKT